MLGATTLEETQKSDSNGPSLRTFQIAEVVTNPVSQLSRMLLVCLRFAEKSTLGTHAHHE